MQWINWDILWLLAQNGDGGGNGGGDGRGPAIPPLALIMLLVVVFYLIIIRPESRKRKAQQAQLEALKKNDRVVTIGGIYGTVASVNREADEVVLKIDEASGVKIRVSVTAISRLVTDKDDADSKTAKK